MQFRKFTMIPTFWFINNLFISKKFTIIKGAVVECGTYKGGMIAGISKVFGNKRKYYLFDSFEGLPPAQEKDGKKAIAWQEEKNPKNYYNNCCASETEAKIAMKKAGINNPIIIKGWFSETLIKVNFEDGIAILRLDADWYDSTFQVLNALFNKVNKGGIIIIDDYFSWDGCSKAVHDYLSINNCDEKINSYGNVCYIIKN